MVFKMAYLTSVQQGAWSFMLPILPLAFLGFYIKPGKNKKGVRGSDFFVGEHELMKYLDRLDLGKLGYFNW